LFKVGFQRNAMREGSMKVTFLPSNFQNTIVGVKWTVSISDAIASCYAPATSLLSASPARKAKPLGNLKNSLRKKLLNKKETNQK